MVPNQSWFNKSNHLPAGYSFFGFSLVDLLEEGLFSKILIL